MTHIFHRFSFAFTCSIIFLVVHYKLFFAKNINQISIAVGVLLISLIVNYFSLKQKVIGGKTHLPLLLSSIFITTLVPELKFTNLFWVIILFPVSSFFISSKDYNEGESQHLIHLGILAGIMQLFYEWTVIFFIIFLFVGMRHLTYTVRQYVLFFIYFIIVLLIFSLIVFVLELDIKIDDFLPSFNINRKIALNSEFYIVFGAILIGYLPQISKFPFRYPVKSQILHFSLMFSVLGYALMILLNGGTTFYIFSCVVFSLLLATYFFYNTNNKIKRILFVSFILCVSFWNQIQIIYKKVVEMIL